MFPSTSLESSGLEAGHNGKWFPCPDAAACALLKASPSPGPLPWPHLGNLPLQPSAEPITSPSAPQAFSKRSEKMETTTPFCFARPSCLLPLRPVGWRQRLPSAGLGFVRRQRADLSPHRPPLKRQGRGRCFEDTVSSMSTSGQATSSPGVPSSQVEAGCCLGSWVCAKLPCSTGAAKEFRLWGSRGYLPL